MFDGNWSLIIRESGRNTCDMSAPLMIRLLSASVATANRAGQVIRDVLKTGQLDVVDKGGNDPQTEADRKAQRSIVTSLSTRFPGINIYGEETLEASDEDQQLIEMGDNSEVLKEVCPVEYNSIQEKDVVVWVDPLDGTSEFTQGFVDHVTVIIGIALGGKAVGGVIHQPFVTAPDSSMGRTVWGLIGLGVKGTTIPAIVPSRGSGLHLVVTRSHYTDNVKNTVEALNPTELLREGGCGNKVMMVLDGRSDAYVYPSQGTKKWDTCAGDAIVRAAGGLFTDIHGNDILYNYIHEKYENKCGLIVTLNRAIHQDILDNIPQSVRAAFPKL